MNTAYDKAKWHYGGDYPKDLPPENGATHIGIFLAWAIINGLEGGLHQEDERGVQALSDLRSRKITGPAFLIEQCDESFTSEDLNGEGNNFTRWYYEPNDEQRPTYIDDYAEVFSDPGTPSLYYVKDTWANYDRMALVVDRRFGEWKRGIRPLPLTGPPKGKKSWWKFW